MSATAPLPAGPCENCSPNGWYSVFFCCSNGSLERGKKIILTGKIHLPLMEKSFSCRISTVSKHLRRLFTQLDTQCARKLSVFCNPLCILCYKNSLLFKRKFSTSIVLGVIFWFLFFSLFFLLCCNVCTYGNILEKIQVRGVEITYVLMFC